MTDRPQRGARRKQRTRDALLEAGQKLLARTDASEPSIQEITDLADVGFGSFYNHFGSKAELFDAALVKTLDDHARWLDAQLADEADAAIVFAVSLRLTGRLYRTNPVVAGVMLQNFPSLNEVEGGLAPRAQRDLERGRNEGRFTFEDVEVALACVAGCLVGGFLVARGREDGDTVVDRMVAHVLRSLGMDGAEADRIATMPLSIDTVPSETT